jgi:hypothetical protein
MSDLFLSASFLKLQNKWANEDADVVMGKMDVEFFNNELAATIVRSVPADLKEYYRERKYIDGDGMLWELEINEYTDTDRPVWIAEDGPWCIHDIVQNTWDYFDAVSDDLT